MSLSYISSVVWIENLHLKKTFKKKLFALHWMRTCQSEIFRWANIFEGCCTSHSTALIFEDANKAGWVLTGGDCDAPHARQKLVLTMTFSSSACLINHATLKNTRWALCHTHFSSSLVRNTPVWRTVWGWNWKASDGKFRWWCIIKHSDRTASKQILHIGVAQYTVPVSCSYYKYDNIINNIMFHTHSWGWMRFDWSWCEGAACCDRVACCWIRCHWAWPGPAWSSASWRRTSPFYYCTRSRQTGSGRETAAVTGCPLPMTDRRETTTQT